MPHLAVASGLVASAVMVHAFVSTITTGNEHRRAPSDSQRVRLEAPSAKVQATAEDRAGRVNYYSDFAAPAARWRKPSHASAAAAAAPIAGGDSSKPARVLASNQT
jgi:hypothetical protein